MERGEAKELVRKILWEEGHIEESEEVLEDRELQSRKDDGGLGMDSLEAVEFVMAVEEETGLEISDEDAEKWVRVGDVLDYLEGR